jgi:ATP-dependent DNA helicase RecQ
MPKSLEHYQQESGRAGRDGLDAECCLLYAAQDYALWTRLLDGLEPADVHRSAMRKLSDMVAYCTGATCRHRKLIEYFGQPFPRASCDACDVCLGGLEPIDDALIVGQKILSCVVRLREALDAAGAARVLAGLRDASTAESGHDKLSTWGLLEREGEARVREWIEQLAAQEYLEKFNGNHALGVTAKGWRVLRGEVTPRLLQIAPPPAGAAEEETAPTRQEIASKRRAAVRVDPAEQDLFDMLRVVRRGLAEGLGVPAYVIFSDAVLREMARRRPSRIAKLRQISGVGQRKAGDFGREFLRVIRDYCQARALPMDA